MSGTPCIQLDCISKRFGGVTALDEVSFEIQRGEIHAVVGENGAGKSTLMKLLAGVHEPDEGEIRIEGRPVRLKKSARSATTWDQHRVSGAELVSAPHSDRQRLREP